MEDVIDRVMRVFAMMRTLDAEYLDEARASVSAYIETVMSAGRTDAQELAVLGLAYLRQRQDGPGSYSGC